MRTHHKSWVTALSIMFVVLMGTLSIGLPGAWGAQVAGHGAGGKLAGGAALPLQNGYWTKTFNGADHGDDVAKAASTDLNGDVVVAGSESTTAGGDNIWVRKYDGSDGSIDWTRTFSGPVPGPGADTASGVSCDSEGNPIVAGFTWNGLDNDVWVRKYAGGDGSTLWTKVYDSGLADMAFAVSCGPDGNPVVAGYTFAGTGDIWVRKYDGSDGSTIWTRTYDGGQEDVAYGVSCDPSGNPVVSGSTMTAGNWDVWVRKYDGADGSAVWTKKYDGGTADVAFGASCDPNGDAVVAGMTQTGTSTQAWIRKYEGDDGGGVWTKTFDAGWHVNRALGVCCDNAGDPVFTGYFQNAAGNLDIGVRKLDGVDGDTSWSVSYDGGHGSDQGLGVSCDPDGNPFVAGLTRNSAGNNDAWVRKYPPGPNANPAWYLAEGSTAWGFDEYISIENPNAAQVHADITYMTSTGPKAGGTVTLPPGSQATVNPRDKLGDADFSTRVVCQERETIAVDRTMSWTGPGAPSPEAHNSVGVTFPQKTWYLPEGSSAWGFECWLLIQNPNDVEAECKVTYMIEGAPAVEKTRTVPANSRKTFNIADDIGARDTSIKVECPIPVIAERAMYRNNRREGHDSIGTRAPALDCYLAEGTTAWGFTTYVLVQNPNSSATDVTLTYMTPLGPVAQPAFSMPANSRKTIRVDDIPEVSNTDLSTRVHGSQPIMAERAMYWDAGTGEACHDSIGMSDAHTMFYLPDGETSNGRETWTLVQNPNDTEVSVQILYLTPNGLGNTGVQETIPANSRRTFNMSDRMGGTRAAILVTCVTAGKKIMCERAMYWNSRGAGTDTIGGFSD